MKGKGASKMSSILGGRMGMVGWALRRGLRRELRKVTAGVNNAAFEDSTTS